MAGRLNTNWYVVYVQTPNEAPDRIDLEVQRQLSKNLEKARELGAEVVKLHSEDPASALLDFARTHRVSDILIGRAPDTVWRRLSRRSVLDRLTDGAEGLDVHIISFDAERGRA
jgi:two-component system sensor histidine kinase KdpD